MLRTFGRYMLKVCMWISLGTGYAYMWYPNVVSQSRYEYELGLVFDTAEVIARSDGRHLADSLDEWQAGTVPVDWNGQC